MNVRIGVLLVPLLVPLILLAVWRAWWSPRSRRPLELGPSCNGALLAGHRKAAGWRWAGWRWAGLGLGVVVAAVTAVTASFGLHNLGAMLSPTVFGLCVIGGSSSGSSQQSLGVRVSGRRPSRRGRSATTCRGGLAGRSRQALLVWAPSWS